MKTELSYEIGQQIARYVRTNNIKPVGFNFIIPWQEFEQMQSNLKEKGYNFAESKLIGEMKTDKIIDENNWKARITPGSSEAHIIINSNYVPEIDDEEKERQRLKTIKEQQWKKYYEYTKKQEQKQLVEEQLAKFANTVERVKNAIESIKNETGWFKPRWTKERFDEWSNIMNVLRRSCINALLIYPNDIDDKKREASISVLKNKLFELMELYENKAILSFRMNPLMKNIGKNSFLNNKIPLWNEIGFFIHNGKRF